MAMRFKRLSLAFVALVAFLAGCPGATAPGACPGWIQRAIEVDVTDSRTGRVERPGYVAWERSSIVARVGACGVETVRLGAALTPQS
jgi:hypothetical protein